MKLRIQKTNFAPAFQKLLYVVPNRTTQDTWSDIRIEAGDNCFMQAMNGEMEMLARPAGVEIERPGACLIPADKFAGILKESPSDELILEAGGNKLLVKSGRDEFPLNTQADTGFGKAPEFPADRSISLPGELLLDALRCAENCTGKDGRHLFGAVCLSHSDDAMAAVAIGGEAVMCFRTCRGIHPHGDRPLRQDNVLLSPKVVRQIASMCDGESTIRIASDANSIYAATAGYSLSARLQHGNYPNWRGLLKQNDPRESGDSVTIPCEELRSAIKRAKIGCGIETKGIEIAFTTGDLTLQAACSLSAATVRVPCDYIGSGFTLRISPDKVLQAIALIDSDSPITVSFTTPENAVAFESGDYLALVMPIIQE